MTASKLVAWFSEVDKEDIALVGGKGANLGEMVQHDFPIPDGFIITSYAYHCFIRENNLEPVIKHILSNGNYDDEKALQRTAQTIRKKILAGKISEDLTKEVFSRYKKLGGLLKDAIVILRAEVTTDGLANTSLTGPLASFSNIQGESSLLLHIKESWGSLYNPKALLFRKQKHMDHFPVAIAVPIQKMINAEKSGKVFTLDPLTNDRKKIIIEAIFGFQDLTTQGQVTRDYYQVNKQNLQILEKKISTQNIYLTKQGNMNKQIRIAAKHKKVQKITDANIVTLAKLGKRLERHYYFPQEIAWAIEEKKIYIIESRPITHITTTANVIESELLLPSHKEITTEYIRTATKIYVDIAESEIASKTARKYVDGVGLLRAELMMHTIGTHPKKLLRDGKGNIFVEKLAAGLESFCQTFSPRPVIYRTSDLKTNDYYSLIGGKDFEPVESNPPLGYRGAFRYIHDPEVFKLELEAIKLVRNKKGWKNLWLLLPFIRTVEELEEVKKIITAIGLYRTQNFKIWMTIEVPSNVILLDKFIEAGIDGISLDLKDLTMLLLGIDRNNNEVATEFNEQNEAVLWALEKVIKTANKHNIPTSLYDESLPLYPSLIEKLVQWGITSMTVSPDEIDATRRLTAEIEKRLIMYGKN